MELKQILVVEDEEDIRKIIGIALGQLGGFQVDLFASAEDALQNIDKNRPDLIILDVMMPNMDGPSLLAKLKQSNDTKTIPVIFMTAKVQPNEVNSYLNMGVVDVIMKPFDPVELPKQVQAIWDRLDLS
ncbi:MAG: response regulator [Gammaproteobacteria bacterium]|nr:response regulator [Gammaproteobacteria bacterium]MDH5777652.1 response regulator [Gammaproteobacteria bacterium]